MRSWTIYAHVDTYDSFVTSGAAAAAPANVGDLPAGVPLGALLVHTNRFEDVYVASRPDGGNWVFHVRIAPEGAR